jgi:hypothetical protein
LNLALCGLEKVWTLLVSWSIQCDFCHIWSMKVACFSRPFRCYRLELQDSESRWKRNNSWKRKWAIVVIHKESIFLLSATVCIQAQFGINSISFCFVISQCIWLLSVYFPSSTECHRLCFDLFKLHYLFSELVFEIL